MDIIKKMLYTPAVVGNEGKFARLVADIMKEYTDEVHIDVMGNVIAKKNGTAKNPKKLMFAAHMDEIGFIVTQIDDDGFVRVSPMGGIDYVASAYYTVIFDSGLKGVLVPEADFGNKFAAKHFYVDIGANDKKAAMRRVKVGDFCSVPPKIEKLSGTRYAGRPFDDKLGCAIMIEAARDAKANPNDVYYVFTVQEEVGCRGSKTATYSIMPDFGVAFDLTRTGDAKNAHPMAVSLGKGAAVKVKDSSVICDPGFVKFLSQLASDNKIPHQLEILESGGTDTCSMQMTGAGCIASAISVPARYIHSNIETFDMRDYRACVQLTTALVEYDLNDFVV
ncbi:MAG: M20/M25/M40 family metallo-hydrolase [Oscillospiraceae bacterium]|nr:M20/M25/M40 family metallo-hydrolase [Oscillospiraceae bacterium]